MSPSEPTARLSTNARSLAVGNSRAWTEARSRTPMTLRSRALYHTRPAGSVVTGSRRASCVGKRHQSHCTAAPLPARAQVSGIASQRSGGTAATGNRISGSVGANPIQTVLSEAVKEVPILVDPRIAGVGVERSPVSGCRITREPDLACVYEHRVYKSNLPGEGELPTATGHRVDAANAAVLRSRIPDDAGRIHGDAMGIGAC